MAGLRGIDVNLVVVLDAILTERSITRASEAIGLTQPAVSGATAKLRKLLGDPLLVRKGAAFELTPRAKALAPLAREAVAEAGRTFNLRPMFDPRSSDRMFRISASDYALATMTAPLLGVLAEEAPMVSVEFDTLNAVGPVDLLRKDVVVASANRSVPGKRQSLFSDSFVCLVRHDHPRLRDGELTLEDLNAMPYVDVVFADDIAMLGNDILAAAGVVPRSVISVPGFLPVPFLVTGTDMYGLVPSRLAELYGPGLGVTAAKTPLPSATLVEAVYWHPSKTNDPALRWLVGILRTTAERIEFGTEDSYTTEG